MSSLGLFFLIFFGSALILTAAELYDCFIIPRKFAKVFGFRPLQEGKPWPSRNEREKIIPYFRNLAFKIDLHSEQAIFYANSTLYALVELVCLCLEKDLEDYTERRVHLKERLKFFAHRAFTNRRMVKRYLREFGRSCRLANLFKFRIENDYYEYLVHVEEEE